MDILFLIFFFLLGASFASFVNVLVFGEKSVRKALKRERSMCESCGKKLVWWELIPVFSWIFLGGKCSKCKKPIPYYHLFTEALLGMMFAGLYVYFQSNVLLLYGYMAFVVVTYFFSMYDIKNGVVPNRWIIPTVAACFGVILGIGVLQDNFINFVGERIISGIGYGLFFILVNFWSMSGFMPGVKKGKQGFGGGDSKYAPLIGLTLGLWNTVIACWVGIFAGAVVGLALIASGKKKKNNLENLRIPFIPFMTFGAWVAILWGDEIVEVVNTYCFL